MPRVARCFPTFLVLAAALACRTDKPVDQAKQSLTAAARALEAGDLAGGTELLSPTFRLEGPEGDLDRPQLKLFLLGLLRQGRPGILLLHVEGREVGEEVTQEVEALLSFQGERARRRWVLTWRREGGTWRVTRARALEP